MGDLEILMAMEQIRQLKARYYRFVDTKNWPEFRGLFTDDATLYFPESFGDPLPIAEAYPMIVSVLKDSISIHHGHMPEITVHDANSATAIWAMEDQVYLPGDPATGASRRRTCLGQPFHCAGNIRLSASTLGRS